MNALRYGADLSADSTCRWTVWAPKARRVTLIRFDATGECDRTPMTAGLAGVFHVEHRGVQAGDRYAYAVDDSPPRPDPASRWQPDGVHAPSAVWSPDAHRWNDSEWKGVARDDLVIYELHVGTFTPEGTFAAIVPRLPSLRELGVTAIELMPVSQFPGRHGWGYDGVQWNAVQNSYGGPAELQRLVDACHAAGLAVILDVIYNHLGPEGNYLGEFGPWSTNRHSTPWGGSINFDGDGCEGMRLLVLDNVRMWIRDFHVDGLRLDAVHAIHDDSRPEILAEIKRVADEESGPTRRPAHVIAESNLNDVRLLEPTERGGCGLDAQWSDDFHHCVHTLLTGERDGYYLDFPDPPGQLVKALNDVFVFDGGFSPFRGRPHGRPVGEHPGDRFVVSIQTHDQVGNRARGERLHALVEPSAQRLAAGLLLLSPHVPLLFMGEEYGERRPFPFFCDFGDPGMREAVRRGRREEFADFAWPDAIPDPCAESTFESARLSWCWLGDPERAGLRALYSELLRLRRELPALRDFHRREASLIELGGQPVLRLIRGDSERPGRRAVAMFNLGSRSVGVVAPDWPECRWRVRSDELRFGGAVDVAHEAMFRSPYESLNPEECALFA